MTAPATHRLAIRCADGISFQPARNEDLTTAQRGEGALSHLLVAVACMPFGRSFWWRRRNSTVSETKYSSLRFFASGKWRIEWMNVDYLRRAHHRVGGEWPVGNAVAIWRVLVGRACAMAGDGASGRDAEALLAIAELCEAETTAPVAQGGE